MADEYPAQQSLDEIESTIGAVKKMLMIDTLDEHRVADGSLALGFAAMLALLYRDPAAGREAATVDMVAVVSFAILPVVGLLSGWYVAADGPYETVLRFTFGTYLGIVGIGVMFGSLLSANPNFAFLLLWLAMLGLAVVALGTIALRLRSAFGLLESSVPPGMSRTVAAASSVTRRRDRTGTYTACPDEEAL